MSQLMNAWSKAEGYEAAGDSASAKKMYESMLRHDPHQIAASLRLARIGESADRFRDASVHVRQAAASLMLKKSWRNLPFVTARLLAYDERGITHELIANADWSDRDVVAQSAVLSQHLWLSDRDDTALRLIDHVSKLAQPSHLLAYARANVLQHCGKMDEASDEFERCIKLAPNYAYAHWSLAYHRKAVPSGSRIDRIRKAQAAAPEASAEMAHLFYALFKEFDDEGDFDAAWVALSKGAAVMRSLFNYDASREARNMRILESLAPLGFLSDRKGIDEERVPIFIVGMPRTGTTVMERILGSHNNVQPAGELNSFGMSLNWQADHFFRGLSGEQSFERLAEVEYSEVGEQYMQRTKSKALNSAYFIDKNPLNFFYAGLIAKALPKARIICMARNPMDACFSNLKELFSGDAYPYSYELGELASHYQRFERLKRHWKQVMPEQFHVVQYEELVSNPIGVARRAADFCGLPFDAKSTDITSNTTPVSTASSSQVREPLHAGNVGAWKRYETHMAPLMISLEKSGCLQE